MAKGKFTIEIEHENETEILIRAHALNDYIEHWAKRQPGLRLGLCSLDYITPPLASHGFNRMVDGKPDGPKCGCTGTFHNFGCPVGTFTLSKSEKLASNSSNDMGSKAAVEYGSMEPIAEPIVCGVCLPDGQVAKNYSLPVEYPEGDGEAQDVKT